MSDEPIMEIFLANPRGFCAGVERAIAIVEEALQQFGAPVYVRHEVVHNRFVCDALRQQGAIFVEEIDEVPPGHTLIFSAHGVPKAVRTAAEAEGLQVFDATCPLVTRVHRQVERLRLQEHEIIMIGHRGHPEVEGTMGQSDTGIFLVEGLDDIPRLRVKDPNRLGYVTQTTLSVDDTRIIVEALKKRFPEILAPTNDDICYATQNRQDAVKLLASLCDVILVVGSPNSSNSNRLREVAETHKARAYLIDDASQLDFSLLANAQKVGITAGASAPESLVNALVESLKSKFKATVHEYEGVKENVSFPLPKALQIRMVKK